MKTYKIKKGWHTNYFSWRFYRMAFNLLLFAIFKNRKIVTTISFNEDALYDFGDDEDKHDWNKAFGVTLSIFEKSNKNAVLMGWKSLPKERKIEITPYFNKNFKHFTYKDFNTKLHIEEEYTFEIIPEKNNAWTIKMQDGRTKTFYYDFTPFLMRLIMPWFGGNDTDGDGIGGTPNQDISYNIKYKIIRK